MNPRLLRDVASPESIASVLVGLLAVVLIATQALAGRSDQTLPGQSSSPSTVPSPSPTMDPAIRNALVTALIVNQSLAARAIALEGAIAVDAPQASDIAELLRPVNTDLTAGSEAADRLLLARETAVLGTDLGAFYDKVMARNRETLGTSLRNVGAYLEGAQAVIDLLGGLPPLNDRISDALARRSDATESSAPSAPTASPLPATPSPPPATPVPASPTPVPASPGAPPPSAAASGALPGLIPNGGFENGLAGWQIQLTDGAQATVSHEPGAGVGGSAAARVDISVGSQARSGISLTTAGLSMAQGATYVINVSARAATAREVRVSLTDGAGQTTTARVFPVGTTWTLITFEVTQLLADPAVQLGLDLGRSDATVWFDNVTVRESPG